MSKRKGKHVGEDMATERRFIEVGPESEKLDARTERIIGEWTKDGWQRVATVPMGKNRRHIVFEKNIEDAKKEQDRPDAAEVH
jgi:hypothetical protein